MQAPDAGANLSKIYIRCFDVSDCCCNPAEWCFGSRSLLIYHVKGKDTVVTRYFELILIPLQGVARVWNERLGRKEYTINVSARAACQLPSPATSMLKHRRIVVQYSGGQLSTCGALPGCNSLLTEIVWNLLGRLFFLHRQVIAEDLPPPLGSNSWIPATEKRLAGNDANTNSVLAGFWCVLDRISISFRDVWHV